MLSSHAPATSPLLQTIGSATIFARLYGELLVNNTSISFFAGPLDITHSLIRASDSAITANGLGSTIVAVFTQDAHDNPVEIAVSRITISTTAGTLGALIGNHADAFILRGVS